MIERGALANLPRSSTPRCAPSGFTRTAGFSYDETPGERGQLAFLIADIGKRREALLAKRRDLDEALGELDDLEERCRADLERLSSSR